MAAGLAVPLLLSRADAGDTKDSVRKKDPEARAGARKTTVAADAAKDQEEPAPISLLDALRQGSVAVEAAGRSDGRINVSVTNRTRKKLRVVLPPGIIAQGATGQMGGMMGGMGGGMGGMGGMGGGMGGMGGGMGGMGGGRMGGGMGGGRMGGGTMPPMMGMMMLARMIMYFCGDYDSWDMRSLYISMGRMGGMGGGMGGMGGGMGGMGGGMGMMGGGMRSVPPTGLPFADLKPGQTRSLPTRLVSLSPPDPQGGVQLPQEGQTFRIADIGDVNENPRVQKAMRRLAVEKASTQVAQLVMWNVAVGLDWGTIAELSSQWSNRFALALARDFVDRLDQDGVMEEESGRILFQIEGKDAAGEVSAAGLKKALEGKIVLGLCGAMGIPDRPARPALACRVQIDGHEAHVQVSSSDAKVRSWIALGKFSVPLDDAKGPADATKLADAVAEGLIGRVVRAQIIKGERRKGKLTYGIKIENASPLRLNGLAAVGMESEKDAEARVLTGISIPPRRSMTVPASEEVVKLLKLKHGIRITALDLSGL